MKYSILVNTCDKFADCWNPFFQLFEKFWPDYKGVIYLNTEYLECEYTLTGEGKIVSVKGCKVNNYPTNKRATWSQCLYWALQQIETDLVLYLQEDYFFKDKVKTDIIDEFAELMLQNKDIKCIHFTDQSVLASDKSEFEHLYDIQKKQKYRVSCQAALWRKGELFELLRIREDAWQFERYGSKRSELLNHRYLVIDKSWVKLNEFEIIPYIFTGIVKGRWIREAKTLFDREGIEMDFSIRGFVDEPQFKSFSIKRIFKNRYNMYVLPIVNWFDRLIMKFRLRNS